MKTIETEHLVETTGGHRFAPPCYPYAPYAVPARPYAPAYAWPYAGYGAYPGYWAPPAFAARRAWWW